MGGDEITKLSLVAEYSNKILVNILQMKISLETRFLVM